MRSILPLTEINGVGGVMVESAAYNPNRRAEWMFSGNEARVETRRQHSEVEEDEPCIPYHPYGYFFLREMKLEEHGVPHIRANHLPELSIPGFWHLFGGLSRTEVIAKFTRSGMIPPVANMLMRITNKQPTPIYVNEREDNEVLFHFSTSGHLLASINHDTGSDLEDNNPLPPEQDTRNIDMFLTNLFHQMAFNWLLPSLNTRVSARVQNYSSCQYYKTWHRTLEANRENPRVIEAIREAFWKRICMWS